MHRGLVVLKGAVISEPIYNSKQPPAEYRVNMVSGLAQNIIKRPLSSQRAQSDRIELQLITNMYTMHVAIRAVLSMALCMC